MLHALNNTELAIQLLTNDLPQQFFLLQQFNMAYSGRMSMARASQPVNQPAPRSRKEEPEDTFMTLVRPSSRAKQSHLRT